MPRPLALESLNRPEPYPTPCVPERLDEKYLKPTILFCASRFHSMNITEWPPAGVVLSVRAFEALLDEIDDLRVEALARRRLKTLDRAKTISHADMMRRFGPLQK